MIWPGANRTLRLPSMPSPRHPRRGSQALRFRDPLLDRLRVRRQPHRLHRRQHIAIGCLRPNKLAGEQAIAAPGGGTRSCEPVGSIRAMARNFLLAIAPAAGNTVSADRSVRLSRDYRQQHPCADPSSGRPVGRGWGVHHLLPRVKPRGSVLLRRLASNCAPKAEPAPSWNRSLPAPRPRAERAR